MTVGDIVGEPLVVHGIGSRRDRGARIRELLDVVGFNPSFTNRYPHEFSGGQRQRIGIARALALSPKLIVCDEPVSALDVSIQAQILNLLKDLQRDFGLAYLFIAHDLAVVRSMSDRIAVMNKGQLVEIGPAEEVYTNPQRLHEGAPLRGADPGPARDEGARRPPQAAARTGRRRVGKDCGGPWPPGPVSGRRLPADVAVVLAVEAVERVLRLLGARVDLLAVPAARLVVGDVGALVDPLLHLVAVLVHGGSPLPSQLVEQAHGGSFRWAWNPDDLRDRGASR